MRNVFFPPLFAPEFGASPTISRELPPAFPHETLTVRRDFPVVQIENLTSVAERKSGTKAGKSAEVSRVSPRRLVTCEIRSNDRPSSRICIAAYENGGGEGVTYLHSARGIGTRSSTSTEGYVRELRNAAPPRDARGNHFRRGKRATSRKLFGKTHTRMPRRARERRSRAITREDSSEDIKQALARAQMMHGCWMAAGCCAMTRARGHLASLTSSYFFATAFLRDSPHRAD